MISFTIITVTFQAEEVIERTLRSVLMQTYENVEHLIIDGASTDHTLQLVEDYCQRNEERHTQHTVRVVSEPDKGLYDAMNKGLDKASGAYVVFLNAGDTLPSADTLELIAGSVGENESWPAVLYGDTDIVDAKSQFLRHRRLAPPERLTWHSFIHGMLVCHQAFYVRTDVAKATPYNTNYRFSADVDWCIRVMKLARKRHLPLRRVHAVLVDYLDGGMTVSHHRDSLKERFWVMTHHYGLLPTVAMHLWFILRGMLKH